MATAARADLAGVFGRDTKSVVHLAIAVSVWIVGSLAAVSWVRRRGLQIR